MLVERQAGRTLSSIRFYTGVPDPTVGEKEEFWHGFWSNKLRYLRSRGVYTYHGRVSRAGQEKGVDVSIAIDLIHLTYTRAYEVAVIISQDWDLGPAVRLAKIIARDQRRALGFESAFPESISRMHQRGIPGTTWVPISQAMYDTCYDPRDYRPRPR
jgi:hypothetical protein